MGDRTLRSLDSTTLADRAYAAIREAIIDGGLESGQKITERGLAELLDVSPTPVREALRRLEQDGLVERAGPRTVQVVDVEDRAIREIRQAEGALRAVAGRLAAVNATPAQLAEMERSLDEGDRELARLEAAVLAGAALTTVDLAPLLAATREFHSALNAGCNNAVILRLLSTVDAFSLAARSGKVAREIDADGGRAAAARFGEHREILDAVKAGDAATVERLLLEHSRADELARL